MDHDQQEKQPPPSRPSLNPHPPRRPAPSTTATGVQQPLQPPVEALSQHTPPYEETRPQASYQAEADQPAILGWPPSPSPQLVPQPPQSPPLPMRQTSPPLPPPPKSIPHEQGRQSIRWRESESSQERIASSMSHDQKLPQQQVKVPSPLPLPYEKSRPPASFPAEADEPAILGWSPSSQILCPPRTTGHPVLFNPPSFARRPEKPILTPLRETPRPPQPLPPPLPPPLPRPPPLQMPQPLLPLPPAPESNPPDEETQTIRLNAYPQPLPHPKKESSRCCCTIL